MRKYLKLFNEHTKYQAFTKTSDFIKPNVSHCIAENHVHYNPWTYADAYLTFVALEDSTFKFVGNTISYSIDNGKTWTSLASNTNTPVVAAGKRILWKAELTPTQGNPVWGVGTFSASGRFDAEGNPLSLIYGDNAKSENTSIDGKPNIFDCLFENCTTLVNAKNISLPSITLTNNCYSHMFSGCSSLVTTPKLPATTLAKECYNGMFYGCTSLTKVPVLPATTMAEQSYYAMFSGCTSLTTAPELPATTLAERCYAYMFQDCTNLAYIKAMFTTTPSNDYTYNWVSGVAASGTFVKNSAATWDVSGVNGIPNGWSIETASA